MYGHMILAFDPKDVGVDCASLPPYPPSARNGYGEDDINKIAHTLGGSVLSKFRVANNTERDYSIRYDGEHLIALVTFNFDPRYDKMPSENDAYAGKEYVVNLKVWVIVDRSRADRLACGCWASEDESVGVMITNDPSKDEVSRMQIFVVSSSMAAARQALMDTLRGTMRPKAWLV